MLIKGVGVGLREPSSSQPPSWGEEPSDWEYNSSGKPIASLGWRAREESIFRALWAGATEEGPRVKSWSCGETQPLPDPQTEKEWIKHTLPLFSTASCLLWMPPKSQPKCKPAEKSPGAVFQRGQLLGYRIGQGREENGYEGRQIEDRDSLPVLPPSIYSFPLLRWRETHPLNMRITESYQVLYCFEVTAILWPRN